MRKQIDAAAANDKQRAAISKDAHLIEAALAIGLRIVALDEIVRGYLHPIAQSVVVLRKICWVNPDHSDEKALEWLESAAPADGFRMLGYIAGKTE